MFFKQRILPAVGIVVVTFGCILLCRATRVAFFAALALVSVYELYQALKQAGVSYLYVVPAAYIAGQFGWCMGGFDIEWQLAWFALISFCALFKVILKPSLGAKNAVYTLAMMLWPFGFYGIVMAMAAQENGAVMLVLAILSAWACDSMALFVGRSIGKHKLAPEVSPNKTWEGAVGGGVFAGVAGVLLYFILKGSGGPSLVPCVVTAVVSSSFGQVGDLAASLIKRMCGVKDYGHFLGEHGGVMDKMDSMLFALPAAWLCLALFGEFGML